MIARDFPMPIQQHQLPSSSDPAVSSLPDSWCHAEESIPSWARTGSMYVFINVLSLTLSTSACAWRWIKGSLRPQANERERRTSSCARSCGICGADETRAAAEHVAVRLLTRPADDVDARLRQRAAPVVLVRIDGVQEERRLACDATLADSTIFLASCAERNGRTFLVVHDALGVDVEGGREVPAQHLL
eukprot:scaffold301_cov243-Pinguiococcus_pyrenoidosus.AAC.150